MKNNEILETIRTTEINRMSLQIDALSRLFEMSEAEVVLTYVQATMSKEQREHFIHIFKHFIDENNQNNKE